MSDQFGWPKSTWLATDKPTINTLYFTSLFLYSNIVPYSCFKRELVKLTNKHKIPNSTFFQNYKIIYRKAIKALKAFDVAKVLLTSRNTSKYHNENNETIMSNKDHRPEKNERDP